MNSRTVKETSTSAQWISEITRKQLNSIDTFFFKCPLAE